MTNSLIDNRLLIMKKYASKIIDDTLPLSELHSIFDEMVHFRAYYQLWHGELSNEYRLASQLLTLSRIFRTSEDPLDGTVSLWLKKHPLHSEWFSRIKHTFTALNEHDGYWPALKEGSA
jgi:hypothetical protein